MKIGIGLKNASYTPEAYAYHDHLISFGHYLQLEEESQLDANNDLNIYFMGFRPIWQKEKKGVANEIHEYQSLSTPPRAKIKDLIKKYTNKKPVGRIFLNNIVEDKIGFNDGIPSIQRDMGVDKTLFMSPPTNPEFDLIYCGSISGRAGLLSELERLAKLGLRILVVGSATSDQIASFSSFTSVVFTGKVSRLELPDLYQMARCGLNYTPDFYPFNIQTSTKTLEYLAAGLGIVSNDYFWIRKFANEKKFSPLWIKDLKSSEDLLRFNFSEVDVRDFSWEYVLQKAELNKFLSKTNEYHRS